jgi:2,4-dienoyl-CoA reductase-like NADH-dependent reductase (Old Yellow Enzyme family)/thioredoxin reductase
MWRSKIAPFGQWIRIEKRSEKGNALWIKNEIYHIDSVKEDGSMKFQKLFSPLKIGHLELPNRIVSPPMTSGSTQDGFVGDRILALYRQLAGNAPGLVIVEDAMVDRPAGKHQIEDVAIDDDKYVPGLAQLAVTIKSQGARAALQISHAGRQAGRLIDGRLAITGGVLPVAPSPIATPIPGFTVPRELTVDEIVELEDKFAQAAKRTMEAGFDAVSFHCTHLYLIQQFLSPFSNKRQDAYGGDFNRRLRFLMEIIRKSKKLVGSDYPMICRICGEELWEGGISVEDARETARRLEAAGVHALSVSLGASPATVSPRYIPTLTTADGIRGRHGGLVHLAAAVKDTVSIPVMTANRILTPQHAEQILQQGKADLICIGRALLADNDWVIKAREGREKEIRLCIGCNETCGRSIRGNAIGCSVNPACNSEDKFKLVPAAVLKKVLVAGGGPAGLEAARVAALRGHEVTLYEKDRLGGQVNLACLTPGKAALHTLIDFEVDQLQRLGVAIRNQELTAEGALGESPDAVIVATGSHPKIPQIPGIDSPHVATMWDILSGKRKARGDVVVIGGRQFGAETAEHLASRGCKVTLIEAAAGIAEDIRHVNELYRILTFSLNHLGVTILTKTTLEEITPTGVMVRRRGELVPLPADTVVLALGGNSEDQLAEQLQASGIELHLAGDCKGVGRINKAVLEGFRAGLSV